MGYAACKLVSSLQIVWTKADIDLDKGRSRQKPSQVKMACGWRWASFAPNLRQRWAKASCTRSAKSLNKSMCTLAANGTSFDSLNDVQSREIRLCPVPTSQQMGIR